MNRKIITVAMLGALFAGAPAALAGPKDRDVDEIVSDHLLAKATQGEIQRVVRSYLKENPEVVGELIQDFLKNNPKAFSAVIDDYVQSHRPGAPANDEKVDAAAAILKDQARLFNSSHQVTLGNPAGDITFVEFFDYNCGYCKRALSDMMEVLKNDPKIKIVLKELPVLGPGSEEAAQVAVAVRMQDSGAKYLEFHQRLFGIRGQASKETALAAAKEAGFDIERIEKDVNGEEVRQTLEENLALAGELGIRGTPGYVVGKTVVPGAIGAAALMQQIQRERANL
jgi:protein-disulfide isomerase